MNGDAPRPPDVNPDTGMRYERNFIEVNNSENINENGNLQNLSTDQCYRRLSDA